MKSEWCHKLASIEAALKLARRLTRNARYGGLAELDDQLKAALVDVDWLRKYPDTLMEPLASLEHDQWTYWSKGVAQEVSEERRARWKTLWVPYSMTPADHKSSDRAWATAVIQVFKTGRVNLRRR